MAWSIKGTIALLGVIAVSGCGGGSSIDVTGSASFGELVDEGERLAEKLDTLNPTTSMPTSGTANYTGVMILAEDFDTSSEGFLGGVDLDADFAAQEISGTASNFFRANLSSSGFASSSERVTGSFDLSGSGFVGPLVNLTVDGRLEVEGSVRDVDGPMLGSFAGDNAEAFTGVADALTVSGTSTTLDAGILAD